MSAYKSDFLRTLEARGFIHQITDPVDLDAALCGGTVTAYIGFDCTAPSLHVGSLVQIMLLRHLQQAGHRPVVLMGAGTTKIGDPSGKDESRQLMDNDGINANMAGIKDVFERFLTFGERTSDAIMVNNADWLDKLEYIPFLREIGPHFTINRMLTFDSVKLRLEREQPLTFLEFNYMILQAYDFLELGRRTGCSLQMGGSDQWGNIVNGMELTRRIDGTDVFGLTSPLITTADGGKMGKTTAGAVWLNADQLSDYDYWQFWRNTQDPDVGRFLRLFTDLPLDEIEKLEALQGSELNTAKILLADLATSMCRGLDAAGRAKETARKTFEEGATADGLPSITVAAGRLEDGIPALELLVEAGLCSSKKEARRLIEQGGARLNDRAIDSEARLVTADDKIDDVIKLSAGRKRHALIWTE